jgi:hypothetical protein
VATEQQDIKQRWRRPMAAYSLPLKVKCEKTFCERRASQKVFDTWNAECGIYCSIHAARWVKEWNREFQKTPHDGKVIASSKREETDGNH